MLFKFTETKVYFIEADTLDEAQDKYSELHNAEVLVECLESDALEVATADISY